MSAVLTIDRLPVASSILRWLKARDKGPEFFAEYICHWIVFNNYYVTLFNEPRVGARKTLDGVANPYAGRPGCDGDEIYNAVSEFDKNLKIRIASTEETAWFATRTPIGDEEADPAQNGVRNMTRHGRYAKIDYPSFEQFTNRDNPSRDDPVVNRLTWDAVYVLYTVRNNIVHGRKRWNEHDNYPVVQAALSLLQKILGQVIAPDPNPDEGDEE